MASNLVAVNLGSYGKFRDVGWTHLPTIGIRHVELGVPNRDQVGAVRDRLAAHGLTASTLMAPCDASHDGGITEFGNAAAIAAQLGVKILFVSVKEGEAARADVTRRLKAMGDLAGENGTTIAIETHPPVAHNSEAALATIAAVDHPHVRLNFDTGNIYYYNHDTDAVAEVKKVAQYVAAVHLKDTDGSYHGWNFPALGEGIVDFAGVFGVLAGIGFHGPYTFELEGVQGEELTEESAKARVANSAAHLKRLGLLG